MSTQNISKLRLLWYCILALCVFQTGCTSSEKIQKQTGDEQYKLLVHHALDNLNFESSIDSYIPKTLAEFANKKQSYVVYELAEVGTSHISTFKYEGILLLAAPDSNETPEEVHYHHSDGTHVVDDSKRLLTDYYYRDPAGGFYKVIINSQREGIGLIRLSESGGYQLILDLNGDRIIDLIDHLYLEHGTLQERVIANDWGIQFMDNWSRGMNGLCPGQTEPSGNMGIFSAAQGTVWGCGMRQGGHGFTGGTLDIGSTAGISGASAGDVISADYLACKMLQPFMPKPETPGNDFLGWVTDGSGVQDFTSCFLQCLPGSQGTGFLIGSAAAMYTGTAGTVGGPAGAAAGYSTGFIVGYLGGSAGYMYVCSDNCLEGKAHEHQQDQKINANSEKIEQLTKGKADVVNAQPEDAKETEKERPQSGCGVNRSCSPGDEPPKDTGENTSSEPVDPYGPGGQGSGPLQDHCENYEKLKRCGLWCLAGGNPDNDPFNSNSEPDGTNCLDPVINPGNFQMNQNAQTLNWAGTHRYKIDCSKSVAIYDIEADSKKCPSHPTMSPGPEGEVPCDRFYQEGLHVGRVDPFGNTVFGIGCDERLCTPAAF